MLTLGFPQPAEYADYFQEPLLPFPELENPMLSFPPESHESAERLGLGTEPDQLPFLISDDPQFDQAQDKCREEASQLVDPEGSSSLLSSFVQDFASDYDDAFWADAARAETLIDIWFDCLAANGWSVDDREAFADDEDFGRFGVTVGRVTGEEDVARPAAGEVLIVHPPPDLAYQPTEEEKQLAHDIVDCQEGEFGQLVAAIHAEALSAAIALHGAEIESIKQEIE